MIDTNELRRLAQAVSGLGNCNQTWLDQSEDIPAVVVGHIGEDGETYPVVTIDCDQYYAADQSLPLGKFYAAANPAVIDEILDRLEAAEKERDELRAKVVEMEKQEPVVEVTCEPDYWSGGHFHKGYRPYIPSQQLAKLKIGSKLYLAPGAQPAPSVAAEREACAKACEKLTKPSGPVPGHPIDAWLLATLDCAEVIRARSVLEESK
jgi:hypothetical protein